MRAIPATRGYVAIVDEEDFYWLSAFKWRAVPTDKKDGRWSGFRPVRTLLKAEGYGSMLMYRQIMRPPPGMVVDHIDGDPWNNRRSNLRICTHAQNLKNQRARRGAVPLKGVTTERGKFNASIRADGESYYLGRYATASEAALAYDAAALVVHGEFACLNFPDAGTMPRHPLVIHADWQRVAESEKAAVKAICLAALRRGLTVRAAGKEAGVSRSAASCWAKEHGLFLTRRRPRNTIIDRGRDADLRAAA